MQRATWWALCLSAAGLVGCGVESHQPSSRFEGKLDARGRLTAPGFVPPAGEDVCADNDWYGDGECDFWCPQADMDCDSGAVCAAFIEDSDGLCRREPNDPCRGQDPDCDVGCPELPIAPAFDNVCQVDPSDPCVAYADLDCQGFACAEYIEMPDGSCSRADDDKCRFQDPDCDGNGTIVCPAIGKFPDGVCDSDPNDPCVEASDPDCGNTCTVVDLPLPVPDGICIVNSDPCLPEDPDCSCDNTGAFAPPIEDGVCEENNNRCGVVDPDCGCMTAGARPGGDQFIAPPLTDGICTEDMDPCTPVDPDCLACAEYIEQPDGVCSREPGSPCEFQDPDCSGACLTPGARPMADGVCEMTGDPCNVDPDCTVCNFFAPPPPPDGECNADPNDPCSFQGDPDCGVACAAFIEVSDGQCGRTENDPCISQDPDCTETSCATDIYRSDSVLCRFPVDSICRPVELVCPANSDA